jgi:VanZ family protein
MFAMSRIGLLVALLVLLQLGRPPDRTQLWDAAFDLGHVLLFAAVAWVLLDLVDRMWPHAVAGRRMLAAAGATVGLAVASECLQAFDPGRQVSVADFLRDLAGITAVWGWRRHPVRFSAAWRTLVQTAAVVLLVVSLVPAVVLASAYVARGRAFPVLTRFGQTDWERYFLSLTGARVVDTAAGAPGGGPLVCLLLEPGKYPGFALDEPYPTWRAYDRLEFFVRSDGPAPLDVTIRIHDRGHDQRFEDRFNRTVRATRELQQVVIPLSEVEAAPRGRRLDLSAIRGVVVFVADLDHPARLWISELTLRPARPLVAIGMRNASGYSER